MQEFRFRPVEISVSYPTSGPLTYQGLIVENDDIEALMHWGNTQIHNFADSRLDYVSVTIESLLQFLGKETGPEVPQRIIIQAGDCPDDLVSQLWQNNFPRIFQPLPSEGELEIYSKIGYNTLGVFLDEAG